MKHFNQHILGITIRSLCVVYGLSHSHETIAKNRACLTQAHTQLEIIYCDIINKDPRAPLPSLSDFKKNSPRVQHLILKREADKQRISLPTIKKKKTTLNKSTPAKLKSSKKKSRPNIPPQITSSNNIKHCQLNKSLIRCAESTFSLAGNKTLKTLKHDALSKENTLNLPHRQSPSYAEKSDFNYLSDAYPIYINKMIQIGLADATMSFTKFAAIYWQNKLNGESFEGRFKEMYEKLKTERKQNSSRSRYRENHPNSIAQCMYLNSHIIVCDDISQNWVYLTNQ